MCVCVICKKKTKSRDDADPPQQLLPLASSMFVAVPPHTCVILPVVHALASRTRATWTVNSKPKISTLGQMLETISAEHPEVHQSLPNDAFRAAVAPPTRGARIQTLPASALNFDQTRAHPLHFSLKKILKGASLNTGLLHQMASPALPISPSPRPSFPVFPAWLWSDPPGPGPTDARPCPRPNTQTAL